MPEKASLDLKVEPYKAFGKGYGPGRGEVKHADTSGWRRTSCRKSATEITKARTRQRQDPTEIELPLQGGGGHQEGGLSLEPI